MDEAVAAMVAAGGEMEGGRGLTVEECAQSGLGCDTRD